SSRSLTEPCSQLSAGALSSAVAAAGVLVVTVQAARATVAIAIRLPRNNGMSMVVLLEVMLQRWTHHCAHSSRARVSFLRFVHAGARFAPDALAQPGGEFGFGEAAVRQPDVHRIQVKVVGLQ